MYDEHPRDDEWLIIHTPDGPRLWNLGAEDRDEAERADLISRGRIAAGVPAHNNWATDDSGWTVMISFGEPHAKLMGRAVVGTLDQLAAVDAETVSGYTAEVAAADRETNAAVLAASLAGLDPLLLAAVMAHPQVIAAVQATT
jgi:hypothetical protein